jgi:hypothetical protein
MADRPTFWDPPEGGNLPSGLHDPSVMGMGVLGIRGQFFNFINGRGTEIQRMMGHPVGAQGLTGSQANAGFNRTTGTVTNPNGLGMAWDSGRTGTATVGPNGQAYVNTRLFGVRGLDSADPRSARQINFRQFVDPVTASNAIIPIRTVPDAGYRAQVTGEGITQDPENPNLWHRVPGAGAINITFVRITGAAADALDLHISGVQARAQGEAGRGNWIEVHNGTGQVMNTRGLYLSRRWNNEDEDDSSLPQDRTFDLTYRMPAVILRPGQTLMLRTTASTTPAEADALKWAQTNFGISFGDRLRMARYTPDGSGNANIRGMEEMGHGMANVLQRVEVTLMDNTQMMQRGIVEGGSFQDDYQWRLVPQSAPRRAGAGHRAP